MNIAVVGCGVVANDHLKTIKNIRDLQLVALCDKDERTVVNISKQWKVKNYYTDFSDMLDNEKITIASILTPPQFHAPLTIEAIKNEINVLVEKPFTMTSNEAKSIFDFLKNSTVKLTVNHIWLFTKVMMEAIGLIKKGVIGEIHGAYVTCLHTRDDPMSSDKNHWCHKISGGRFGEMLPHPVYSLQSLLGDELRVVNVLAAKHGDYSWMPYDELNVTLEGENGLGNIYVSYNAPRQAIIIDVFGAKKVLRIDLINQTLIGLGPRKISKLESARDNLRYSSNILSSTVKNALTFILLQKGEYSIRTIYRSFIDSIYDDSVSPVTPRMAYNTVKIVENICQKI